MQGCYCYLDIDIDNSRKKLATCAAFVDSTNLTYGFSSKDLLSCGGSELARLPELIANDHKWSSSLLPSSSSGGGGGILTQPPKEGNRLVIQLYWDVAPMACENFATLCANGSIRTTTTDGSSPGGTKKTTESKTIKQQPVPIGDCGKPLTYRGCPVHRIVPGFILQAGDFVLENGSGGECVFKNKKVFKDERPGLNLKHDRFGLLSMGNSGKNSNSSQFFFTLGDTGAPQCDGKHVVFGECVSGGEILKQAETFGTTTTAPADNCSGGNGRHGEKPTVPITITDCGLYIPFHTPGGGFWYDKPDPDSYTGLSPTFIVRPRIAIVAPTKKAKKTFLTAIGTVCSVVTTIIYEDNRTDDASSDNDKIERNQKLLLDALAKYSIDIILISPACKAIKTRITTALLPEPWKNDGTIGGKFSIDDIVLVAKPIDAISVIQTKSWLAKYRQHWQLDGR